MVQNQYDYIEFLVRGGLQENTAYSYSRYLEAVSTHLNISIGYTNLKSNEDVTSIIKRLSNTELAQNYQNNCGTALRAYFRFVKKHKPQFISPDEIKKPEKYNEGAKKTITVNSYERDNTARNKCIEIHGLNCVVCNINFEETYGSIGIGFIHVHHIKPLSEIKENYKVDPEKDLIPVCPNCHAMLHRPEEILSIESLRKVYNKKSI